MSQQQDPAVIKINHIPGCVSKNSQRVKGRDYSLGWELVKLHLVSCVLCPVWRLPGYDRH